MAERRRQARGEGVPVHRVEGVLDQQPEVGLALHQQAAAEEEGVRVFLAEGQGEVVAGGGGDRQVGRARVEQRAEAARGEGEAQGQAVARGDQPGLDFGEAP